MSFWFYAKPRKNRRRSLFSISIPFELLFAVSAILLAVLVMFVVRLFH
jgi:hypothetical protein